MIDKIIELTAELKASVDKVNRQVISVAVASDMVDNEVCVHVTTKQLAELLEKHGLKATKKPWYCDGINRIEESVTINGVTVTALGPEIEEAV